MNPIVLLITTSTALTCLCGCPSAARQKYYTPPGPTSLSYHCDMQQLAENIPVENLSNTVYFTWLNSPTPQESGRILVSNDKFNQHTSALLFIVDNEKRIVDQVRDRSGVPIAFDLNSKIISLDAAVSQLYMRIGNLILDSSPRAIQSAPKNAVNIAFQMEQRVYQFNITETIPSVENYSQLPRTITSANNVVCVFDGFAKRSASSGGGE